MPIKARVSFLKFGLGVSIGVWFFFCNAHEILLSGRFWLAAVATLTLLSALFVLVFGDLSDRERDA